MGWILNWIALVIDSKTSKDNGSTHPGRSRVNVRQIGTSLGSILFWVDPVFSRVNEVILCHKSGAACAVDKNKILSFKNRTMEVTAPPQQLHKSGIVFLEHPVYKNTYRNINIPS